MSSTKLDDEDKEFGYKLEQILNEVKYDGPADQAEGGGPGQGNVFDANDGNHATAAKMDNAAGEEDTARALQGNPGGTINVAHSQEEEQPLRKVAGGTQLSQVSPAIPSGDKINQRYQNGGGDDQVYVSRRVRKYDDDQSQAGSGDEEDENQLTESNKVLNTAG